jgi:RNA polymerase primary sigma factor
MTATAILDCHRPETAPAAERHRPDQVGLSREEEVELTARATSGDRRARDRMVEANLGLVRTIARDFRGRGLELDDLIGEGHMGLIRAVERFDPRVGTRFSTYAAYWIREAIRRALANTASAIRVPVATVGLLTRWRRAERALARELGRMPGFEEIAAVLGLNKAQRQMVARALQAGRMRREGDIGEAADGRGIAEMIARVDSVEGRLEAEEDCELVRRRIGRLDDRERTIIMLRYGFEGESLTLQEIGARLGITREGVRKIELRALAKLADE